MVECAACPSGETVHYSVNPTLQKYSTLPKFGNGVCVVHPGSPLRGGHVSCDRRAGLAVDAAASCAKAKGQGGLLSVSPGLCVDERRCQVRRVIFRWQRAQRRRTLWRQRAVRTAKPCGPGRRCYGQAPADAALASTGAVPATFAGVREARRNSAPGRARHKPSDHRAGKAVCWASPVCCCAVLPACAFRAVDRGCRRHPAFPAPSWTRGRTDQAKLGRKAPRGCEAVSPATYSLSSSA